MTVVFERETTFSNQKMLVRLPRERSWQRVSLIIKQDFFSIKATLPPVKLLR